MTPDPKHGEEYWSIKAPIESEGDDKPRKPWLGRITIAGPHFSQLSRIGRDGLADLDRNASSMVPNNQLHRTKAEANRAYLFAALNWFDERAEEQIAFVRDVREVLSTLGET